MAGNHQTIESELVGLVWSCYAEWYCSRGKRVCSTPRVDEGQSKSRMRRKWLEHVLQVTGQKYMSGVTGKVV